MTSSTSKSFNIVDGGSFYKPVLRLLKDLPDDYVGTMAEIQAQHGDLVHLRAMGGFVNFVFISDAQVNRELYVRNTDALAKSPSQIQTFLYAAGSSVATAHGDDWRTKRKEANNLFSRSIIEASCQGQVQVIQDFVATLDDAFLDGTMLAKRMAALTSSRGILGRAITLGEADMQIAFSKAAADRFNAESAHLFARPNWMLAPWRRELTARKQEVFPIVQAYIDDLRGSGAANDGLMNHYVNGEFVTSNDDEMLTILVGLLMGAQDNIAAAMGWALALLAQNPDTQDQIKAEVNGVSSDAASLNSCQMLKATVTEVLRMRPPAQGNQPRILQKEVEIADHILPKGAYLFNSFYNMQHDPQVFPDPGTFDPTRFLDGALASTPNFVPFGHGPRNCVAQSMAIQQLMAIVKGILRDHVLVPEERELPEMRQTPFLVPAPFKVRVKSKH